MYQQEQISQVGWHGFAYVLLAYLLIAYATNTEKNILGPFF